MREIEAQMRPEEPATAAEAADELRVLAKTFGEDVPPQEIIPTWEAAQRDLRGTAEGLDAIADGKRPEPEFDRSFRRGAAALYVLGVEGCEAVFPAVGERLAS